MEAGFIWFLSTWFRCGGQLVSASQRVGTWSRINTLKVTENSQLLIFFYSYDYDMTFFSQTFSSFHCRQKHSGWYEVSGEFVVVLCPFPFQLSCDSLPESGVKNTMRQNWLIRYFQMKIIFTLCLMYAWCHLYPLTITSTQWQVTFACFIFSLDCLENWI